MFTLLENKYPEYLQDVGAGEITGKAALKENKRKI
jgi:hypothetical protein